MIGMTDDNLPRFHRLDDGVLTICGYNGRGIAPGTVFGRCLANLVLGSLRDDDCPLPCTTPRGARFRVVRDGIIELGAQLPHLRSQEHTSELQSIIRISYPVPCLNTHTYSTTYAAGTHP